MSEYKISLGVDVDVSDIQSQINTKAKDVSIPIKLEVENIGDIKKQIQGLGVLKDGIEIPLSIDSNATIKSAQQVGQKIGTAITKNVKQSINIDDIIDKEVLSLMKTFSIAGDKGSDAFKEIRQALIECRNELQKLKNSDIGIDAEVFDTSRAFDKVSDAIANQMRAVNNLGDEYIKLAEYMANFNNPKKGNKVRVPDFIKQEQGDDYKSSRGTLGIAFNTEKGISFASFIEDLNHELGIAIDLTKGEEKAYEELLHKVRLGREQLKESKKSENSLQATASTDEILSQNYINKNEIRDIAESSIDYINATEAASSALVQDSVQATNAVVQNEERKQQAYRDTAKTISSIQKGNFQKVFDPADDDLGGMKNTAKSVEQYFKNLQGVISDTVSVKEQFDSDGNLDGFTVSLKNANGEAEKLRYTFQAATEDSKAFFKYAGGSIDDNTVGKQTEKSIKKANDLQIKLDKIQSGYLNSTKPIKDNDHVKSLGDQYNKVKAAIDAVRNADDATYQSMVSNVETEIATLENLVAKYRNIETVATSLRSKDFDTVKATYADKLDEKISKIQGAGVYKFDYGEVNGEIVTFEKRAEQLKSMLSNVAKYDRDGLVQFLNELDKLESGYKKAKAAKDEFNRSKNVISSVSSLKSEIEILEQASPSLKNFKASIKDVDGSIKEVSLKSLLEELNQVGTAGDFKVVEGKLKAFTMAAEAAGIDLKETESETKNVNDEYRKLYNTRKEIGRLETQLISETDAKTIETTLARIDELQKKIDGIDTSKFTKKQKASLEELEKSIAYTQEQALNKADKQLNVEDAKAEAEKIKKAFDDIYNVRKQIGQLEVELIGAKAKDDISSIERINAKLEELRANLKLLNVEYSGIQFTDEQKASLKEQTKQIQYDKKVTQDSVDYKANTEKEKAEVKEVNEAYQKLYSTKKRIGQLEIDLIGAKAKDDKRSIQEITKELGRLQRVADSVDTSKFTEKQNDSIKELNEAIDYSKRQAQNSADYKLDLDNAKAEVKEVNEAYKQMLDIRKQIRSLSVDEIKLTEAGKTEELEKVSAKLKELRSDYAALEKVFKDKLSPTQFGNLQAEADETEDVLSRLKASFNDLKAGLAKSIKADIELGNIDNQMDAMRTNFNSLSDANDKLRNSFEATEKAYKAMVDASKANTGDEVADRERLIQAEKEYAAALEKTNNLIKQQARADKISNDALRLQDDREIFQAKIDSWLTKNSAATEMFGAKLKELRAAAETADRVELNHLEKELIKVDKAADKAGLKMMSLGDRIKSKAKEYMAYLSVAEVFMWIEQAARAMFDTVLEIDTAMTGLYRVTDLTSSQYDTLFNNMISSAKEYGATLNDIINATSDWVRAGFDADTALGLAEVTTMYQHISDLDYDTAAENLITAYNGFKNELDTAFSGDTVGAVNYIADIFNELDRQNCPLVV